MRLAIRARLFRVVCFLAAGVTAAAARPVIGADHRDGPIITRFDHNVGRSDVYVFKNPDGEDSIYVAAQTSQPGFGGSTNQIVFNRFDGDLDNPPAFANPIVVFEDTDAGFDAKFPQIAANSNGVVMVTHHNSVDFSAGPPTQPPSASYTLFDSTGALILAPTVLGTPGAGQGPPTLAATPDGKFTTFVAEGPGSNGLLGGSIVAQRFNDGGTPDATFTPTSFTEPSPAPEGFLSAAIGPNRQTSLVSVGNYAGGFPAASDILLHTLGISGEEINPVQTVNTTPAFNANIVSIDIAPPSQVLVAYQKIDVQTFAARAILRRITLDYEDDEDDVDEIKLGTAVGLAPLNPQVAVNDQGESLVTYHAERNVPGVGFDPGNIYAERFAPNGTRIGGVIQVNTTDEGEQKNASVDDLSDGGFVIGFTGPNPTTLQEEIFGIDLRTTIVTNANTIIAHDFANPFTPLDLAGFAFLPIGGIPNSENKASIADDPINSEQGNGVLQVQTGDAGGGVRVQFNPDLARERFSDGGTDAIDYNAYSQLVTVDLSAEDVSDEISGNLEVSLLEEGADVEVPLGSFPFSLTVNGNTSPGIQSLQHHSAALGANEDETADWTEIKLSYLLTPEQVALLNSFDNPAFSYALEFETTGPALFYLDNLRVDLVPIPEPGTTVLLASAMIGALRVRRGKYSALL